MKKLISSLILAGMVSLPTINYAKPSELVHANSNRCVSHLNEMVQGDSLILSNFYCWIKTDDDMQKLTAFLSEHPAVKNVQIQTDNYAGISINSLADIMSLTSIDTYTHGDAKAFARNKNLTKLRLIGSTSDEDLTALATIPALQELEILNESGSEITDNGIMQLAKNTTLTSVNFDVSTQMTDAGRLALLKNKNLIQFDTRSDVLSNTVSMAIAKHPSLQEVAMYGTKSQKALKAIINNQHLTRLRITSDVIDDDMAIALSQNLNFTDLHLTVFKMSDAGFTALSKLPSLNTLTLLMDSSTVSDDALAALIASHSLKTLNLYNLGNSNNNATLGLKALAALANNSSLKTVFLLGFTNGDDIAAALAKNASIQEIRLEDMNVQATGAKALAKSTISRITLSNFNTPGIGDEGATALAESKYITSLYLYGNNISSLGAKALAKNTSLIDLYLTANHIDDEGAKALADNVTLKTLILVRNNISSTGLQALKNNPYFISLSVSESVSDSSSQSNDKQGRLLK